MSLLVVGGAGFIGSHFILEWLADRDELIINFDKLTYAGNLTAFASLNHRNHNHIFVQGDIVDQDQVLALLKQYRVRAVLNFAAESHVDRSIQHPAVFVQTNIVGTFCLLEAARFFWESLASDARAQFRFLQISTDEVYGSLAPDASAFQETHCYQPNNPYAASKAAGDHLVRAYHQTYRLPTLTIHGSNNYGPRQFPEKLIPLVIHNALVGKPIAIHGDGQQQRDWLYVTDHCCAIRRVLEAGRVGEVYNIGGRYEQSNLAVVNKVCNLLDALKPRPDGRSYRTRVVFVPDRLGQDRRYAMDTTKIEQELGWRPFEAFDTGIQKTVQWTLDHQGGQ